MKLASVRDTHPVEIDGVTYRLRTPTVLDAARLRRLARAAGARPVPAGELKDKLKAGLKEICAEDPAEEARWLGVLEEHQQLLAELRAELSAEQAPGSSAERLAELDRELAELEAIIERHCPPYAQAVADAGFWRDMLDLAAVRLLLVLPGSKPSSLDGLSDNELARLPTAHLRALQQPALALFAPTESERKNSASRPGGAPPPTDSTLTATAAANGSPPTLQ